MSDLAVDPGDDRGSGFYSPKPIKRSRRTKAAMVELRKQIVAILEADHPQTVRQVFYALTVRGTVRKDEIEYQRTVVRLLSEMREAGTIPFNYIAHNTRWQRKRERDLLKKWAATYAGVEVRS
jgi:hypothetical protein